MASFIQFVTVLVLVSFGLAMAPSIGYAAGDVLREVVWELEQRHRVLAPVAFVVVV